MPRLFSSVIFTSTPFPPSLASFPVPSMETQFVGKTFQRRPISSSQQQNDEGIYRKKRLLFNVLPCDLVTYMALPALKATPLSGPQPMCSASYKQSISKAKCATCFWQLDSLANVDKWTESPEGFYESAAAWQIYLLAATKSCTGKNRLRWAARLPLPILVPYCLGVHAHAAQRDHWPVIHQYCEL